MRNRIRFAALAAIVAVLAMLPASPPVHAAPGKYMASQEYQATAFVPSVLAATATEEDPIFVASRDVLITSVNILPQAAVTGDSTNSKTLDVVDKSTDGTGTTAISTSLVLATGVNLTAFKQQAITLASSSGYKLAQGKALSLKTAKVGTGVLMPGLHVVITYEPR
jgi:hypothetical protein